MGPGWRVGRLAGIDLAIHPSWLVIAFLLTFSLADVVLPETHPGMDGRRSTGCSARATAFLFFASVLAHEFSHALVARRLRPEGRRYHALHLRRRHEHRVRLALAARGGADRAGGTDFEPRHRRGAAGDRRAGRVARGRCAAQLARVDQPGARACSTSCRATRWTAGACCAPSCGGCAATRTRPRVRPRSSAGSSATSWSPAASTGRSDRATSAAGCGWRSSAGSLPPRPRRRMQQAGVERSLQRRARARRNGRRAAGRLAERVGRRPRQ